MSAEVFWTGLGALLLAVTLSYFGRRWQRTPRWFWPLVWTVTVLLAVGLSWIAIWRHLHFETHAFDLGIFDQALWHASHFSAPASTIRGIGNLFGDHFHPIILLLVPLYWIWSSPIVLLVAQACLLSLIFPLGTILGRRLGLPTWAVAVISLAAAVHPGILAAINFDFHEIAFAPAFMLLMLIFAVGKQWRWYWLAVVGLILTKESMAIYAALLGLTIALRARPWHWKTIDVRHGLATLGVGLISFFLITRLIIPALSDGQGYVYLNQYDQIGDTPATVVKNIVLHPQRTFTLLRDAPEKIETTKYTVGSFLYFPLLTWTMWPMTLLTLGERFWTTNTGLWMFQFHYQVGMMAVYLIATLLALADFSKWKWSRGLAYGVAVFCVGAVSIVYIRVTPLAFFHDQQLRTRPVATWNTLVASIPNDAVVSAQDAFAPHLTHRTTLYHFPNLHEDTTYIALDPRAPAWPYTAEQVAAYQTYLRTAPEWILVFEQGPATVFKRK